MSKISISMLDFSETDIQLLAIHSLGDDTGQMPIVLSDSLTPMDDAYAVELLKSYFLASFKQPEFYSFNTAQGLEQHGMFNVSSEIFANVESLLEQSQLLAKQLGEDEQAGSGGDLFVVYVNDCVVDGELVDALGVFVSDNKETFLTVYQQTEDAFGVKPRQGINIRKLDKGCLIFNTEKDFGYKLMAVDSSVRNISQSHWINNFLNIKLRQDDFYQTKGHMNLCKSFIKDVLSKEDTVDKTEQAAIITKTRDYFTQNESYNQEDFENNIIAVPQVVEQYREYKEAFEAEQGYAFKDSFAISDHAAKQANRVFKSVIKLDKNFHLYIHGGRDRVERGYDQDKGMGYYKLYFDAEG